VIAVAGSQKLVASPRCPRPGGERLEEEAGLEAADLEDLETAAEEATVAASQTQAHSFQLHWHAADPPQPMSICTEESLRADRVFASECLLAISNASILRSHFAMLLFLSFAAFTETRQE
jgi:hypothetical protein